MTQTTIISSQLDYVVTLLEGLVGRQETTETTVVRIDERTAHLTPQHAHYVREMVDRIVLEIDRRSPGRPLTYAQVYAQVYGRLKHHFRVAKYDQVSDERFEQVQIWLQEEWRRVRGGTLPEQGSLFYRRARSGVSFQGHYTPLPDCHEYYVRRRRSWNGRWKSKSGAPASKIAWKGWRRSPY